MTELPGKPRLKAGCRMSPAGDVLLIPEGALQLAGPARAIVEACDGTLTVAQLVDRLVSVFVNSDRAKVHAETSTFLTNLAAKGVLEFV